MERCIDASIAVKWYIQGESYRSKALQLLEDSVASGITLIAPPLFEMEVDSIIQTRLHDRMADERLANRTLDRLDGAPVTIVDHPEVRRRARQIARLTNQRKVYDSTYATLADLRGCEFWTADKAFYDDANPLFPFIKYILNYP